MAEFPPEYWKAVAFFLFMVVAGGLTWFAICCERGDADEDR